MNERTRLGVRRGIGLVVTLALFASLGCGGTDDFVPTPVPREVVGDALLGPLAGATVEIYEYRRDGQLRLLWTEVTTDTGELATSGRFNAHARWLRPGALYLYRAIGGRDLDADDDGVLDPVPTDSQGDLHALVTGRQVRAGQLRINLVTECLYQVVSYLIRAAYPPEHIVAAIDRMTPFYLAADLDGDGRLDGDDLLHFHPVTDRDALRKGWTAYDRVVWGVHHDDPAACYWTSVNMANPAIGQLALPERVRGVAYHGTTAYLAGRESGIFVVDVADPKNPTLLRTVDTPGEAENVHVRGDLAYVADLDGLVIFDLQDPAFPTQIGRVTENMGDDVEDLTFEGEFVLCAAGEEGVKVVDASDPGFPELRYTIDTDGDVDGLHAVGSLLYVADDDELRIFEWDGVSANQIGWIDPSEDHVDDVRVAGDYAFVTCDDDGLVVVDVSDPSNPVQVADEDWGGDARRVNVMPDGMVYVSDQNLGVAFLDAADPTQLDTLGVARLQRGARDLVRRGNHLLVAGGEAGFFVLDLTMPADQMFPETDDLLLLGAVDPIGVENLRAVIAEGNYAYAVGEEVLAVFDISQPRDPRIVARRELWGDGEALVKTGDWIYVACSWAGIHPVDVSNPRDPEVYAALDTSSAPQDIDVSGDYLYVAEAYEDEFIVVDISSRASPVVVGRRWTPEGDSCRSVAYRDGYCFVAYGFTGLRVVDVSDPTDPFFEDGMSVPPVGEAGWSHLARLRDDLLFMTAGRVHVIDVADPDSPEFVTTWEDLFANEIVFFEDYAYLADGGTIVVVDIRDVEHPVPVMGLPLEDESDGLCIHRGLVIATDDDAGLKIFGAVVNPTLP